ncbi:fumarylacetoacetase [uncultured Hydrogenophaga sp.]|uniref:fumarylacetoacetase n=1 Tax=uncultured Hydrogenophaga sp. TaxID=199683 RepID=UPI00258305AC|nr:fumarylacetoacetase [uncultured Hydrogenophaga sp.]
MDHTHNPEAVSWLNTANQPESDFPLQNLPLCLFDRDSGDGPAAGMGIGDQVLNLRRARPLLDLPASIGEALSASRLNALFALGRPALTALRHAAWSLLERDSQHSVAARACLVPQADVRLLLPCDVGDYTDFFASLHHARNTFNLFRPGQVFLPNFQHLPIAYHGRASSIVVSGHALRRPLGQTRDTPVQNPKFGPTRKLDFEVELGVYVGRGNALGEAISIDEAEQHMAGVSILNDWSARDVQAFESQPLGPFLSKNFLSSVAPWVVSLDALEPFRSAPAPREEGAPPLQAYLDSITHRAKGAFDIHIETRLQTQAMRDQGLSPERVSHASAARDLYWTPAQMFAHHTVGGCNLRTGDFLGSGTISGPDAGTEGSLIELTHGGTQAITLPNGERRTFLEDGDEVSMHAWCERPGFRRIGLGRCLTRITNARSSV